MSYEIFYRKQFIKINDEQIIPVIEAGSNNCFEVGRNGGRGRRARSWQSWTYHSNGKLITDKKTIEQSLEKEIADKIAYKQNSNNKDESDTPENIRKKFGWYVSLSLGSKGQRETSFDAYKAWVLNGIKTAMTVEELNANGVSVYLYLSEFSKVKPKNILPKVYPKTTSELVEVISLFESKYPQNDFYIGFDGMDHFFERRKKERRFNTTRKEKTKIEVDHFFVISMAKAGFFVKFLKYGYRYSFDDDSYSCKRFLTEKQAQKWIDKHSERSSLSGATIRKVNKKVTLIK